MMAITALVIISGFCVMKQIDSFIDANRKPHLPQSCENQGMLLFGTSEATRLLEKAGLEYRSLERPVLPNRARFTALFAVSGNDGDNLTLCYAAKSSDPGIYIVARCNDPALRQVYSNAGVSRLLYASEAENAIFTELFGDRRWK